MSEGEENNAFTDLGPGRDSFVGGNDAIQGTKFADLLYGGAGKDVIRDYGGTDLPDGGPGRESCVAERERRCERG